LQTLLAIIEYLQITMHNVVIMQCLQRLCYLNKYVPDRRFLEECLTLTVLPDSLQQIPSISMLHYYTISIIGKYHSTRCSASKKHSLYAIMFGCLTEAMMRTSFSAFSRSFSDRNGMFTYDHGRTDNLLHSIYFLIALPTHLIDAAIGTLAYHRK
jgi:hypothetical protein